MLWAFPSATSADLADIVRCREIAFSQSVEAQDLSGFKSFIDDDARFVSNAVRKGPDAVAEAWGNFNSVWRMQADGSWMVIFDAGSPANSAPAEEIQALLEREETCD